ncbi:MAG: DUF4065 domain-containing protein [Clostridia bacterium]|nr:DUF4065 domain-containing protein [Clostridia bacterium]
MAKLMDVSAFFIALAQDMAELQMGDAMTNLRLQTLLYYAQGWSLARHGEPLFEESIEAWEYGPVVPVCHGWYRGFGHGFLTAQMPPKEAFTADEYELLTDTFAKLSRFSTSHLLAMTRKAGSPWDRAWNHSKSREIPSKEIGAFFSKMPLSGIREKLDHIPVIKPLYRKDGVPVLAAREA